MDFNRKLDRKVLYLIIVVCLVFIATKIAQDPIYMTFSLISIIIAVSFHEAAHAWSADRLGDPTARLLGRKTLNPIKHLDPIGSLLFLIAGFGWGKPVPVDSFNLKSEKDDALISLAGPASNLLLAIVAALLNQLIPGRSEMFSTFLYLFAYINIALAVFNLLPVPPLDGSKLYRTITPKSLMPLWQFLDTYGFFVLLIMYMSGSGIIGSIIAPIIRNILNLLGF